MSSKSWFAKRSSRANESRRSRTERKTRPVFDTLEDRAVPAIIISHVAAPTPSNNDFTVFKNAMNSLVGGETVEINGTLDWSEPNAFSSWAGTGFNFAMPHVNGVTLEPMTAGSGIKGPGTEGGEAGPIYFDGLGTDKSWNITGLTIKNFDVAIFYSPEVDVTSYSGTHITDNTITVPNAGATSQNGGIILGPSPNQVVQGNMINITGNGGASSSSFGISAFTFRGAGAWNNLLIDNNSINVSTTTPSDKIIGFSENTSSTGSNITVSNNTFRGDDGSLASNQQVAFGITSDSTATATVVYQGNVVHGALDGFVWGDPEASPAYDFSNDIGITFSGTTMTNVGKGFVARDGAKATVGTTTIANSGSFNFGTAFSADGAGTIITVTDPVSNYTGVQNLKSETNGGQVIFSAAAAGISNVSKFEGNTGFTLFSFPVQLDVAPSANQIFTVDFNTSSGTADGNDYLSSNGTLTFQPGQSSSTVSVRVIGDFVPEADETFFVNLSNPLLITNGSPAPGHLTSTQATGTILNDDVTSLSASISGVSHAEGNSGTTLFTFPAVLNSAPAAGQYFTVDYSTSNAGTGAGFADGNDYAGTAGTLTFLAGSTTPVGPLTVTVFGDGVVEPNETFNVVLSNPQLHFTTAPNSIPGNLGTSTAVGTILNDDSAAGVVVSVNSVAKAEGTPISGNPGSLMTTFTFTISYTGTITNNIKVNYATSSVTADGNDYSGTSGQVTFTVGGATTMSVTVMVYADKAVEANETFDLNLSIPNSPGFNNYTLGTATGIGTIINDD